MFRTSLFALYEANSCNLFFAFLLDRVQLTSGSFQMDAPHFTFSGLHAFWLGFFFKDEVRQRQELQALCSELHHLTSTQQIPGIYNSLFLHLNGRSEIRNRKIVDWKVPPFPLPAFEWEARRIVPRFDSFFPFCVARLNEEDNMRITSMGNGDDLNAFLESNSPLNDS